METLFVRPRQSLPTIFQRADNVGARDQAFGLRDVRSVRRETGLLFVSLWFELLGAIMICSIVLFYHRVHRIANTATSTI